MILLGFFPPSSFQIQIFFNGKVLIESIHGYDKGKEAFEGVLRR